MDLERKLNLYQVFQQLYEDHRELLIDLLQLEDSGVNYLPNIIAHHRYVIGVIDDDDESVYLMTNLLSGCTQKLYQPQLVWTIGRGQDNALTILDEHLSRHHAAIHYLPGQGFVLHDLHSTNGSFINHESVGAPISLREGDRIRVGSTVFSFFICEQSQRMPAITTELLRYFVESSPMRLPPSFPTVAPMSLGVTQEEYDKATSNFRSEELADSSDQLAALSHIDPYGSDNLALLTSEEQAELLERFFEQNP